jgi:hypothetical protein
MTRSQLSVLQEKLTREKRALYIQRILLFIATLASSFQATRPSMDKDSLQLCEAEIYMYQETLAAKDIKMKWMAVDIKEKMAYCRSEIYKLREDKAASELETLQCQQMLAQSKLDSIDLKTKLSKQGCKWTRLF